MVYLLFQAKTSRHSSRACPSKGDAGIQLQGSDSSENSTVHGSGLRHPCRNDGHHGFTLTALYAVHIHHAAPLFCPDPALLSDEQLDMYAERFQQLNAQYALTTRHHFIFEDFLDSPDVFEIEIHRYFANKALFENRRAGGKIHLHTFLRYPDLLEVAINIEEVYRESEAAKCERLLPKQVAAVRKIELAEMTWFQELLMQVYEQQHRVLIRGGIFFEPNRHHFRCERKQAGKAGKNGR